MELFSLRTFQSDPKVRGIAVVRISTPTTNRTMSRPRRGWTYRSTTAGSVLSKQARCVWIKRPIFPDRAFETRLPRRDHQTIPKEGMFTAALAPL